MAMAMAMGLVRECVYELLGIGIKKEERRKRKRKRKTVMAHYWWLAPLVRVKIEDGGEGGSLCA